MFTDVSSIKLIVIVYLLDEIFFIVVNILNDKESVQKDLLHK